MSDIECPHLSQPNKGSTSNVRFLAKVVYTSATSLMKHAIDPTVDCVFKALLGADENRNLLIHFLNAVLHTDLKQPIADVEILNPYNEKEFIDDKLSIVDVKVRDRERKLYQIEIQLSIHCDLPQRILYMWTDLYSKQIQRGDDYRQLQPTYSIWLLEPALIKGDQDYLHSFRMQNAQAKVLIPHGGIVLLELAKFRQNTIDTELARWLQFFKEGKHLDDEHLPDWMQTHEMRQAMKTLKQFSEKERIYDRYQARLDYQRVQRAMGRDREEMERDREEMERDRNEAQASLTEALTKNARLEQEREAAEQARADAERAKADAERARTDAVAEVERLRVLLKEQMNKPDD